MERHEGVEGQVVSRGVGVGVTGTSTSTSAPHLKVCQTPSGGGSHRRGGICVPTRHVG